MRRRLGTYVGRPAGRLYESARVEGYSSLAATIRHGLWWRARRARMFAADDWRRPLERLVRRIRGRIALEPVSWKSALVPRITVIVTTRNRSELLPIALRSVQLQDYTAWECVVVDDASTDDSVAAAQRFVAADARFRLLRTDRQLGLAAARNVGLAASRAEYVCFLDDDDFFLRQSLSSRLRALEGQPSDVAGSFCDWVNTDPDVQLEAFSVHRRPVIRGQISFTSLRDGPPFIATAPLLRTRVLQEVGGFDENLVRAEDAELWQRVLRGGFRFVDAEHVGVAYRRSPGSMVLSQPSAQLDTLLEVESRADATHDHAVVNGPAPVLGSLADLTPAAVRAPQIYRYLALIAMDDYDDALRRGRELLPDPVRAGIDVDNLSAQLLTHAIRRSSIQDSSETQRVEAILKNLVRELVPARLSEWTPTVDPARWVAEHDRGKVVGPPPPVVPASAGEVTSAVVLIVEASYHVDEFGPLAAELHQRGHKVRFMMSPKTVPAALAALGEYTDHVLEFNLIAAERASAILALNDWGAVRELMEAANRSGVPTLAKVEGVQDFDDCDTGRQRLAYRTAKVILGQGPNDVKSLPGQRVHVVGSSRLEKIWLAPPVTPTDSILVNVNFTYNVLTDERHKWIESVRTAVEEVGAPAGVSAHPAERSDDVGLPVHDKPFRHLITQSGVLVSRFSTVPFEAMARGVPFVYHNPHGEGVPTFTEPRGAFQVSRTSDELATAISNALHTPSEWARRHSESFFRQQVDVDPSRGAEERSADVIEALMS